MNKTQHFLFLPIFFFTVLSLQAEVSFASSPAAESSPEQLWSLAREAYRGENFLAAKNFYQEIVARGFKSEELYFNLGNCYYRLGEWGKARLFYERARALDPLEDDTNYNLALLLARLNQVPAEQNFYDVLAPFAPWLLWGLLAVNGLFFGFMSLGLFIKSEGLWWGRWFMGIIFLVMLGAAGFWKQSQKTYAIVLQNRAEVRSGPGDEFPVGFVAPEGQKVVFFERTFRWVQIGVAEQGLKGWVAQDAVEKI